MQLQTRPAEVPDGFYMDYIAEKKRIEYEYAKPYLTPLARPEMESEADLRSRVRHAILNDLSPEDTVRLNAALSTAYRALCRQYSLLSYDR